MISFRVLPVLAYFLGAGISPVVLVIVIVIEEMIEHNHEEDCRRCLISITITSTSTSTKGVEMKYAKIGWASFRGTFHE